MSLLRLVAATVDLSTGQILRDDGQTLSLTPRELSLLTYFASHSGEVIPREALLREVWGYAERVVSRTIDTTMRRLRAKIERDPDLPDHILTAHGLGYRFALGKRQDLSPEGPAAPLPCEELLGRSSDLDILREALSAPGLVTLVGPPGVGKTSLARAVSDAMRQTLVGGVWFADLSALARDIPTSERAILSEVASSLGLEVAESARALEQRVERALSSRGPALLVLDNCEPFVEALRTLTARWRSGAPALRILAASRERIGLPDESVHPVLPLPSSAAVALFTELAARDGVDLSDPRWLPDLTTLVERLDHLPLAITLAASRSSALSPRQMLARLDDRFRLLTAKQRDAAPRHRTLSAALDISWSLLSRDERQLLAAVSVFRGGFDAEAAAFVAQDDRAASHLERLCARSLLAHTAPHEARYTGLLTILDYASEQLASDPEADAAARARHSSYFAALCARSPSEDLVPERWNVETAIASALSDGRHDDAAKACLGLQEIVERIGPYELARDWTLKVLASAAPARRDRCILLIRLSSIQELLGLDPLPPLREAIALSEPGSAERLMAERAYAAVLIDRGQVPEAEELLERLLSGARALDQPRILGATLRTAATHKRRIGATEQARAYLLEAAEIARNANAEIDLRYTLGNLAILDRATGRLSEAAASLRAVQQSCAAEGLLHGVLVASRTLAQIAIDTGDAPAARAELQTAEHLARTLGDSSSEIAVIHTRALLARMSGAWAEALEHHRAAYAAAERLSSRVWLAIEGGNIGEMLLYLGDLDGSEPWLRGALDALHQMSYRVPHLALRCTLAELALARGHLPEAEAILRDLMPLEEDLPPDIRAMLHVRRGLWLVASGRDARNALEAASLWARNRTETAVHVDRLRFLAHQTPPRDNPAAGG